MRKIMQYIAQLFDTNRDIFVTVLTILLSAGYLFSFFRARYELKKYVKYVSLHKHLLAVLKLSTIPVFVGIVYGIVSESMDAFTVTMVSSFIITGFVLVVADKIPRCQTRMDFVVANFPRAFLVNMSCIIGLILYFILSIEFFEFDVRHGSDVLILGFSSLLLVLFATVFVYMRIWIFYTTFATPAEIKER